MQTGLYIAQTITATIIVIFILLQARGTGLGSAWSGGGETYHTKRGLEKILYHATIVSIVIFIIISLIFLSQAV